MMTHVDRNLFFASRRLRYHELPQANGGGGERRPCLDRPSFVVWGGVLQQKRPSDGLWVGCRWSPDGAQIKMMMRMKTTWIGGFQRGASGRKEKNQRRRREETKRGKRKVERDQEMRFSPVLALALDARARCDRWFGMAPHEPWIMVRLATSVEPLNFVFLFSESTGWISRGRGGAMRRSLR